MAIKIKSVEEVSKPLVSDEVRFTVNLPSKGKLGYPEIIECRPLKVRDFKILSSQTANDILYTKRLCDVVQNTILTPDISVYNLCFPDFIKIVVSLKVNSTGADYELSLLCNNCFNPNRFIKKINLINLNETDIADDYVEPCEIDGINVRLPRMSVYNIVSSTAEKVSDYDFVLDAIGKVNYSIDDLPLNTYKKILEFINKYDTFGLDTEQEVKCPACGGSVIFTIPFRQEFFIS